MGPIANDKVCCVPECSNTRAGGSILHSFPHPEKEPERFKTWMYRIGGDILALDNMSVFKYRKVCHDHFSTNYFTISKRLSPNAIPTLKLAGFHKHLRKPEVHINTAIDDFNVPSTSSDLHTAQNVREDYHKNFKRTSLPLSTTGIKRASKTTEVTLLKRKIKNIQRKKTTLCERLKKALKLSENPSFVKATKNFTAAAMIFLMMQFKQANKGKFGRRYTKDEKLFSLAFYKMGPKAYRWFRSVFVLPAPVTLSRMISNAGLHPGINECIFKQLKKRVSGMSQSEKLCLLMFDEMALSPHFDFNKKKDLIRGFVDNGTESHRKIADHVLVFMIRGIVANYKQPLAYYFCKGSTSKVDLKKYIKTIIIELQNAGLKVMGTICDQGTNNVGAIKELVKETQEMFLRKQTVLKENIFVINNQEILPLFDVPHLIKGIRNNLLTKNLTCIINNKRYTAKWEDILKLYKENPEFNGLKFLPKLTDQHVLPNKIKKMKVKCATQVFSSTVAMCMGYFADKNILPPDSKETARIIHFFDTLFDSMNGSYGNSLKVGKPLLGPVKPTSKHEETWVEAKKVLKTMQFIDNKGKCSTVPSINNWLFTINNFMYMKEKLHNHYKVNFWMRHFNQDPLENFFGAIRNHGIRNVNPTCAGFEIAFAAVLVNNLCGHSKGSNCEKDSAKTVLMKTLKKIFFKKKENETITCTIDEEDLLNDDIIVDIKQKAKDRGYEILKYVTGYVIKKAQQKIFKNCSICKDCMISNESRDDFTRSKEYNQEKFGLTYPTTAAITLFSNIQDVILHTLKQRCFKYNFRQYAKLLISVHCNFNNIKCEQHKTRLSEYIVNLSCTLFINSWCKTNNDILSGLKVKINESDDIQKYCLDYINKRKK